VAEQLEQRFFAPARARLGARRWDEAGAAGARMTFEQAVALAIAPDPRSPA
jgi:hypothetical protein